MIKHVVAIAVALLVALSVNCVWASDTETITALANVGTVNPTFSISIIKSLSATTYDWANPKPPSAGMNFGTLTNAVASDPTSALAAGHHFMVLVGVITNTGASYAVKYTGAPLAKSDNPTITLPGDAWTVSADQHYSPDTVYPAGISTGVRSAEDTYVVYNSNASGTSDTIRLYFGITGDPAQAAGTNLIPPTQLAGDYYGTVKLDVYAL
ncbi:MAG: hypothetical protein ABIH40_06250 [Candidatus Omnitrophota bacterium]